MFTAEVAESAEGGEAPCRIGVFTLTPALSHDGRGGMGNHKDCPYNRYAGAYFHINDGQDRHSIVERRSM